MLIRGGPWLLQGCDVYSDGATALMCMKSAAVLAQRYVDMCSSLWVYSRNMSVVAAVLAQRYLDMCNIGFLMVIFTEYECSCGRAGTEV